MDARNFSRLVALYGWMASGAFGCASTNGTRTAMIERLIDKQAVASAFPPKAHLESQFVWADGVQSLMVNYPFERRAPAEHYMLLVSVAPAGHFLDPTQYEARRAAFEQTDAPIETQFPEIGLRAQREFFGFGPGGSSYGLTFTTQDGQQDVRVAVSMLLPETVNEPDLDLDAFARHIEARYDSLFVKSTSGKGKEAP
ncbi:hypothetical protein [Stigmatella aurantiaca]|uniref:Lipoprotein n=1 Tax=Stigmatella aurantiaca (strain DW4/3-1) TaxID=378806 RepID=E3FNF1_STIAD|nr:hypothetical protein [Stigmatella aurantiaca]ADO75624.1 uncharacterized protein STAUR_7869 [Stigmatella aurantiaca DW4/3-1]